MIRISTANGKLNNEDITEAEETYLGQIISIDGAENVVLAWEPILNGSGRGCGTHMTITDEAWEAVQEAVKESAEYAEATDDPDAVNAFDVLHSAYEQFGDAALSWGDDDEYAPVDYAELHMGELQFCVKQEDGGYTYSAWEVRGHDATPLIEHTWTVDPSEATRAAIMFFSDKKAAA